MATNSLQSSLHHHHNNHTILKPTSTPSTLSSSLFLKLTTPTSTTTTTTTTTNPTTAFSVSSTTTSSSSSSSSSPSSQPVTFDFLQEHLSNQNFRRADEETRRLLIVLAGEAAQKRGYVFFSEVQFISEADLKAIDLLWRQYSNNKFGYSVQRRIWQKVNKDFTKLFLKLGWMKKLDTEVEQYNYRAFPNEFMWELKEDTPEGHLPLTNALRGTQLLNSVLSHPAFEAMDEESKEDDEAQMGIQNGGPPKGLRDASKPLSNRVFKPDYSF